MPNFADENAVWSIFDQKRLICVVLGWNLKTTLLYLKSALSTKMLRFGTKKALFGYFWAGIWKQYCHIWDHHSRICVIAKFCGKIKMSTFGVKNVLFFYFWAGILKKELLSFLESALLNLCICKISRKNENA